MLCILCNGVMLCSVGIPIVMTILAMLMLCNVLDSLCVCVCVRVCTCVCVCVCVHACVWRMQTLSILKNCSIQMVFITVLTLLLSSLSFVCPDAAEWGRGFHSVCSFASQSTEGGPGDCRPCGQWLHEEE